MNEGIVEAVEIQDLELPTVSKSCPLQVDEVLSGVGLWVEVSLPRQFVDKMARQIENYGHYEDCQYL